MTLIRLSRGQAPLSIVKAEEPGSSGNSMRSDRRAAIAAMLEVGLGVWGWGVGVGGWGQGSGSTKGDGPGSVPARGKGSRTTRLSRSHILERNGKSANA